MNGEWNTDSDFYALIKQLQQMSIEMNIENAIEIKKTPFDRWNSL